MDRRANREVTTRTFMTAEEADRFAATMGKRVTGTTFRSDSVKVTVREARFEDIMPEPLPKVETITTTATRFNMNGSISFQEGSYGTK